MESGGSTPVYRIVVGEDIFYLRLAEQPGEDRVAEACVHQLLLEAGVSVPAIVRYESQPSELDRSATLTTRMPGVPLLESPGLDSDDVRGIARAAGRDLARINQVPVEGFGWVESVAADGSSLVAEHTARSAWTKEYARAAQDVMGSGLFTDYSLDLLQSEIARWRAHPDRTQSFLAHGDFDVTHIFMAPSTYTYTGIIDFGEIRGADRLYDLGHALLQDAQPGRPPVFPDLLAGYREIVLLPDTVLAEIYDQAIAIGTRQLAIFRRRSSPYTCGLAAQIETLLGVNREWRE
ncbi:MAG: phosphotransferase family protein [Thermomicrobiales bacterium]